MTSNVGTVSEAGALARPFEHVAQAAAVLESQEFVDRRLPRVSVHEQHALLERSAQDQPEIRRAHRLAFARDGTGDHDAANPLVELSLVQCRREIAILLDEHGIRVRLDDEPAVSRFVERMRSGESVLWPGRRANREACGRRLCEGCVFHGSPPCPYSNSRHASAATHATMAAADNARCGPKHQQSAGATRGIAASTGSPRARRTCSLVRSPRSNRSTITAKNMPIAQACQNANGVETGAVRGERLLRQSRRIENLELRAADLLPFEICGYRRFLLLGEQGAVCWRVS